MFLVNFIKRRQSDFKQSLASCFFSAFLKLFKVHYCSLDFTDSEVKIKFNSILVFWFVKSHLYTYSNMLHCDFCFSNLTGRFYKHRLYMAKLTDCDTCGCCLLFDSPFVKTLIMFFNLSILAPTTWTFTVQQQRKHLVYLYFPQLIIHSGPLKRSCP